MAVISPLTYIKRQIVIQVCNPSTPLIPSDGYTLGGDFGAGSCSDKCERGRRPSRVAPFKRKVHRSLLLK